MPKDTIIEALGESQLLLPGLVAKALEANDRVKYLLSLLAGRTIAADGLAAVSSLREERLASGIDDPRLDRMVAESVSEDDGSYRVPDAEALAAAGDRRHPGDARAARCRRRGGGASGSTSASTRSRRRSASTAT